MLIPNRDLIELPLNGRNFTQLGTLMPGVIAPPAALGGQAGDATPGGFGNVTGGFTVNGMRNQSNNFLLDGAPNNDSFNTGFVLRPPPDAIDEFRILTHAFGAEYGRNAGAVVSVVTRAGTREWRTSGWWFNRDDALEARNRFAVTKPALEQHQFGAAGGGAVGGDHAFVFGYYEGFRNRRGTTDTRVVPSAAQRAGDFAGGPAIRDPLTGQPFPGNVIPPHRLDGLAARLLDDYVPLPNQPGNRYTQSPDVVDRRHQGGGRLDVNAGSSHKLMTRVHAARTEQRNPLGPANFSPAGNVATARLFDVLASEGFVVGPTTFNEVRVSVNRIDARPNVTSGLDPRDAGFAITPSNTAALGLPNIGVNGFFTLGDAQQPFASRVNDVLTIADDLTRVAGRHTIKGGLELRRDRIALAFINRPNGNFTFNGQYTGNAAADFLLGLPQQYRQASGDPKMDGHTWTTSVFVQDDWRSTHAPHRQRRRALRARGAVRRARRQAERVPSRRAVDALPGGPDRAGLSGRSRRAARHLPDRRQQRRAPPRRGLGRHRRRDDHRARRLGPLLRHAGGAGRLLPERDAGAALPAADRGELLGRRRRRSSAIPSAARRAARAAFRPGSSSSAGGRASRRRWRSIRTCRCSATWRASSVSRWPTSGRGRAACRSSSR